MFYYIAKVPATASCPIVVVIFLVPSQKPATEAFSAQELKNQRKQKIENHELKLWAPSNNHRDLSLSISHHCRTFACLSSLLVFFEKKNILPGHAQAGCSFCLGLFLFWKILHFQSLSQLKQHLFCLFFQIFCLFAIFRGGTQWLTFITVLLADCFFLTLLLFCLFPSAAKTVGFLLHRL